MKKFINILIISFLLLVGCKSGSVKPIQLTPVKPLVAQELVLNKPTNIVVMKAKETNVIKPTLTNRPFLTFKGSKGAQSEVKTLISQPDTNVWVPHSNAPSIGEVIKKEQKQATNRRGLITYYCLVFGIGAAWFFYGRHKLIAAARRLLLGKNSEKK